MAESKRKNKHALFSKKLLEMKTNSQLYIHIHTCPTRRTVYILYLQSNQTVIKNKTKGFIYNMEILL